MFKSFIKPVCKVTKKIDKLGKITKSLQTLVKQDVLIGIPQANTSRKGEEITNAELAYIHEHGSPMHNIPARPFLGASIEGNKQSILAQQKKVIRDALAGKPDAVKVDMGRLGLLGQKSAKEWFMDPRNQWPPNAPKTIKRKTKKWSKGDAPASNPLIDTGALRHAITYLVREDRNA